MTAQEITRRGIYVEKLPVLPPLPQIAPLHARGCNGEMINAAVQFLEHSRPELLCELAAFEDSEDIIAARRGNHGKICDEILEALADGDFYPETALGRLDLVFEITRRIRAALHLPEIAPLGRSLSPRRAGEYPPLPRIPVPDTQIAAENVPQDAVENMVTQLYAAAPELFFDLAEATRLFVFPSEIRANIEKPLWNMRPDAQKNNGAFLGIVIQNIHARLDALCGFSAEMKKRGYLP